MASASLRWRSAHDSPKGMHNPDLFRRTALNVRSDYFYFR